MERFKEKFEKSHKGNSLLIQSLSNDRVKKLMKVQSIAKDSMDRKMTNGLHMISSLYLYTNAPPHGYGTPAPKVAETVLRAYQYDRNEESKTYDSFRLKPKYTAHPDIKTYPFEQTTGNFHPRSVYEMSTSYFSRHSRAIIDTAKRTIDYLRRVNPDVLTKGRQTWDPESLKSITSSKAYMRYIELLTRNGITTPTNCLEFLQSYMSLFQKDSLSVKRRVILVKKVKKYSRPLKSWIQVSKKRMVIKHQRIKGRENVQDWIRDYSRSFCSYIKHGERGKKDRRAIASANIPLRMLLHAVEYFHLELAKLVPGNTISIGGEEKKMKINQELTTSSNRMVDFGTRSLQATEDATKWNECLNPVMFALVHDCFFNDSIRQMFKEEKMSDDEVLFANICCLTFSLMAIKRISLGPGVVVTNGSEYKRVNWNSLNGVVLNQKTALWYAEISEYLEDDGYVFSSPGFLMGMLNAASTTIGLLPENHKQPEGSLVTTLRSSDDSMTVFSSPTIECLACSIEINRKALKLIGINPSTSKSFFFKKGFGEYTSWYQDGNFVAQCGVETSSLKPGGNNAQDDFNSIAMTTATLMRTNTINKLGALSRIIVGVDNVRRLWKVHKKKEGRKGVSEDMLFLADGGSCPWNLENLVFDEATIRFNNIKTDADRAYFLKVMDPQNPFSDTPEEQVVWSKQLFSMTVNIADTARNVFCYVRRSNKTMNNETSKVEAKQEKYYREAHDIMMTSDPSLHIKIPQSKFPISDYIKASMMLKNHQKPLTQTQQVDLRKAFALLDGQFHDNSDDSDDDAAIDAELHGDHLE